MNTKRLDWTDIDDIPESVKRMAVCHLLKTWAASPPTLQLTAARLEEFDALARPMNMSPSDYVEALEVDRQVKGDVGMRVSGDAHAYASLTAQRVVC